MATPSNSQNTASGTASAQDALKKTESTHLSAGYRASLQFVLVPRTSISFDTPDWMVRTKFKNPADIDLDLPIMGSSTNFPPGDLKCGLTWQVTQGEKSTSYPVDGTVVMKVQPGGRFHVEVNGRTPVVDLIAQRLIGEGKLGFSLTPDFPHAETAVFPPSIEFNNTCRLKVTKPEKPLLGERVSFTPEFAAIFSRTDLELRVLESDDGSNEIVSSSPTSVFTHPWSVLPSLLPLSMGQTWTIGFTDDSCDVLADLGGAEEGSYEFTWQLWGKSKSGQQFLLLEEKDFLLVPKPRLETFRIDYDPSWEGTWEVSGKLSGVSPRADLLLDVALVEPHSGQPAPMDYHPSAVRLALHDDGVFEGYLGERHWLPTRPEAGAFPLAPAFAILSLPATVRDGKPGPTALYLDFDDTKMCPFKGQALSWDDDADWVCSEEAVLTEPRPPRPKRRKSGLNMSKAPPPEAGNPRTPLTFEDMWNDLTAWEGVVAYMYQDTEGHVTVGAGNLIPSLEKAKTLPFQNMDAGRAATPQEIETAFKAVTDKRKALTATEYAVRPTIALTDQTIRDLLKARLDREFLPRLRNVFKDFESYPRPVRRVLLDMVYNVGVGAFPDKFPTLTASVLARNWAAAVDQCRVKSRHEERNEWRKALFRYASTLEPARKS